MNETQRRLAVIAECSGDAMITTDLGGLVQSWNSAAEAIFDYRAHEAIGRPITGLVLPEHAGHISEAIRNGASLKEFETSVRSKHGRLIETSLSISRLCDEEGRVTGAWLIGRDIGAQKQADRELRETAARFEATFEQAAVGLAHVGLNGEFLRVNERLCQIVGYSREELLNRTFTQITHPEDIGADWEHANALLRGDIPTYTMEKRYFRKDGSVVWINLTVSLVRDALGAPQYFLSVVENIHDRKAAEDALRQSEERLKQQARLLDLTREPIFTWELGGAIQFWNRGAELLYGWTPAEAIGQVSHDLLKTIHPISFSELERSLLEQGYWTGELVQTTRDKTFVAVESRYELVRIPGSKPLVLETDHDITERKRAENFAATLEARVRERTAQLEAMNRDLESFSYSVSHDLRAPLISINGFAHILFEDYLENLPEKAKQLLHRIRANSLRMGELIDDLLRLSRVSRTELRREQVNLGNIAESIVAELRSRSPARQVSMHIEKPLLANGDPRLLRIALENLIGNAWKFTRHSDPATIEIGSEIQNLRPVYYVRDNGAGFDMSQANRLFAPFQRLHPTREFEGNGIGLATVARIVHRHGGEIWAKSELGKGAAFFFSL